MKTFVILAIVVFVAPFVAGAFETLSAIGNQLAAINDVIATAGQ